MIMINYFFKDHAGTCSVLKSDRLLKTIALLLLLLFISNNINNIWVE